MKYVYLMTKNPGKLAAAQSAFTPFEIEVRSLDFDIPEIQAESSIKIASYAVQQAFEKFKEPVIREDHSFLIDALNMPGPYMSYIEKSLSVENLIKILKTLDNRNAHFELSAAYADRNGTIHEFSYTVPVVLNIVPKGDETQKWNRLIRFENEERVFAEYKEDEGLEVWNKNYQEIAKMIVKEG